MYILSNKRMLACSFSLNPYPAKVIYLHFQPLEVVDRGSETQPQVVENDSCHIHFENGWKWFIFV